MFLPSYKSVIIYPKIKCMEFFSLLVTFCWFTKHQVLIQSRSANAFASHETSKQFLKDVLVSSKSAVWLTWLAPKPCEILFSHFFVFLSVERAFISVPQFQIICYGVVGKNGFGSGCWEKWTLLSQSMGNVLWLGFLCCLKSYLGRGRKNQIDSLTGQT